MRIDLKTLKNLSVETVSGSVLGHVADLELEIEGQSVVQYRVRPSLFGGQTYLISRGQVVSITDKKMVVDDAVSKPVSEPVARRPAPEVEPIAMREQCL